MCLIFLDISLRSQSPAFLKFFLELQPLNPRGRLPFIPLSIIAFKTHYPCLYGVCPGRNTDISAWAYKGEQMQMLVRERVSISRSFQEIMEGRGLGKDTIA